MDSWQSPFQQMGPASFQQMGPASFQRHLNVRNVLLLFQPLLEVGQPP